MRPVVNGVREVYEDHIEFRSHNIASSEGEAWASQYSLRGHPAFLLLDSNGQERWRYIGVVEREQIENELQKLSR